MDWIVPVSESERAQGALLPVSAGKAYAAMRSGGCVLLRGVFPTEMIDAVYREFLAHYGAMDLQQMSEQAAKPLTQSVPRGWRRAFRDRAAHAGRVR